MPVSGEVMYSDAWMERNGADIPMPWRNVCRNLCRGFELGNDRDILLIWDELKGTVEQARLDAERNGKEIKEIEK